MDALPMNRCPDCGSEIAPGLLACPSCGWLMHSETLKSLAAQAEAAEQTGDLSTALSAWRNALDLLPPESRQHGVLLQRIQSLSAQVEDGPPAPKGSGWKKGAAGVGGIAALLSKFWSVFLVILTKGKFLLFGLTKWKMLLSMLLSLGVYWSMWGWKFALGFIVSLYIHEMGHVWMLKRYGIKATAPMFIPGFGAFVRLQQHPATVIEDARIGLAGPVWGMGAALAAYGIFLATGVPIWGGIAQAGAFINLFNLIPIWQLDGGRGFRSLTKVQRGLAAAASGALWLYTAEEGHQNLFLVLVTIFGLGRVFMGEAPPKRDDIGLFQFVLLLIVLGLLASIQIPGIQFS
jgi:Zn-dependent protease